MMSLPFSPRLRGFVGSPQSRPLGLSPESDISATQVLAGSNVSHPFRVLEQPSLLLVQALVGTDHPVSLGRLKKYEIKIKTLSQI